jgi:hypothetical protein
MAAVDELHLDGAMPCGAAHTLQRKRAPNASWKRKKALICS